MLKFQIWSFLSPHQKDINGNIAGSHEVWTVRYSISWFVCFCLLATEKSEIYVAHQNLRALNCKQQLALHHFEGILLIDRKRVAFLY